MLTPRFILLVFLFAVSGVAQESEWKRFEGNGFSFEVPFVLISDPAAPRASFRAKGANYYFRFDILELNESGKVRLDELMEKVAAESTARASSELKANLEPVEFPKVAGFPAALQKFELEKEGKPAHGSFLIVDAGQKVGLWSFSHEHKATAAEILDRLIRTIKIESPPSPQLQEAEAQCAKIRLELALLRPILEQKKKAASPGDLMAVEKTNAELLRYNQQAARLAKIEESVANLKAGTVVPAVKPAGNILFQPTLFYTTGTTSQNGTGFFARTASGRIAAVSSSHYLDFGGAPVRAVEWMNLNSGKAAARMTDVWGLPGKGNSYETDYWILPAPDSVAPVLELDYRQSPPVGESVWFPNKPAKPGAPIEWIDGQVVDVKANCVVVRLKKPIKTQSQSGSPILSAVTGKVLGTFAGASKSEPLVMLAPIRCVVERATVSQGTVPLESAFEHGVKVESR